MLSVWIIINWCSVLLSFALQITAYTLKVTGKGVITKITSTWAARRGFELMNRGETAQAFKWLLVATRPRAFQLLPLFLMLQMVVVMFFVGAIGEREFEILACAAYWWPFSILFLDDIVTGKDRNWRKKLKSLKNTIKWRRWKPSPILVPVPTR